MGPRFLGESTEGDCEGAISLIRVYVDEVVSFATAVRSTVFTTRTYEIDFSGYF